ncbi:MAG: toll/interleukin-1 receptor domain-containing protein [Thermoproteota archaeon]|nr:toll/interleukin-1 receptor domain-containing protein [Thermoproteota archaeon]
MTTKVFLSHSSADSKFALKIYHWLKDFQFIKNIWIDIRELKPGMEVDASIRRGIKRSRIVIVIVSNKSKDSKWVKQEIQLSRKYGKTLIPILYKIKPEAISLVNLPFKRLLRKKYVSIDLDLFNIHELIPALVPRYQIIELPLDSDLVVDQSLLIDNLKELRSKNIYILIKHTQFDKSLIKTFEESVRLEQDNQGLKKLETFRKNILPLFWSNTCFVLSKFVFLTLSSGKHYATISEAIHNLVQELFHIMCIKCLFDKISLTIVDNKKNYIMKRLLKKIRDYIFPRGAYDGYLYFVCHLYYDDRIRPDELIKFNFLGSKVKYQSAFIDSNRYRETEEYLPSVPLSEISDQDWYKIMVPQFLSYEIISKTIELKSFRDSDIDTIGLRLEDYQTVN